MEEIGKEVKTDGERMKQKKRVLNGNVDACLCYKITIINLIKVDECQ